MIKPIILTEYGETLLGYPGMKGGDEQKLGDTVGVHQHCQGCLDLKRIADKFNAVECRACKLRVVLPRNTVATFGDLRSYLAKFQPALAGAL